MLLMVFLNLFIVSVCKEQKFWEPVILILLKMSEIYFSVVVYSYIYFAKQINML